MRIEVVGPIAAAAGPGAEREGDAVEVSERGGDLGGVRRGGASLSRLPPAALAAPLRRETALEVRLAQGDEVEEALALRHAVFCEEFGATAAPGAAPGRDEDAFDALCDHLVVIDRAAPGRPVVGAYRLLREDVARGAGGFYSSGEYDLSPLAAHGRNGGAGPQLLELGRSCVAAPYRTHATILLLWRAIASYLDRHEIGWLFGCASFPGTDPGEHAAALAWLHRHHRAPPPLRVRAHARHYVEMAGGDAQAADGRGLPPLIKGYLRVGASVGDGAFVDHAFNTVDVFMVMPVQRIVSRYRRLIDS